MGYELISDPPYPYSADYSAFGSRSKSNRCCSPGHAKYSTVKGFPKRSDSSEGEKNDDPLEDLIDIILRKMSSQLNLVQKHKVPTYSGRRGVAAHNTKLPGMIWC